LKNDVNVPSKGNKQQNFFFTDVPIFYIELGLNDFDEGKFITRAIGRGGP
jgi:hypothetical protein